MPQPALPLEVPLLPDEEYVRFLGDNKASIEAVYFSLHMPHGLDGRPQSGSVPVERLAELLQALPGVKKHALLNSRFHCPRTYSRQEGLSSICERLDTLHSRCGLDGIVYLDHYLLQALSDASPELCSGLEAIPGVNFRIDSLEALFAQLEYIESTRFLPPGKVTLDRSCNRNLEWLVRLARQLGESGPSLQVSLLANEGCLPFCPFKPAHESHIALANLSCGEDRSAANNFAIGCARYFLEDFSRILRSPFIRPEDVSRYQGLAHAIKLSGRTRGPRVMQKIVEIYLQGSYSGNLLELMDTLEFLSSRLYLANESIPEDFLDRVAHCRKQCAQCGFCRDLAAEAVWDMGLRIKPMWA